MDNRVAVKVAVKELFSIEPFNEFKALAGWAGREVEISSVSQVNQLDCLSSITEWNTSLLVLGNNSNGAMFIQKAMALCLERQAGAVALACLKEPFIPNELLDAADAKSIPIIHVPHLDKLALAEGLERVRQLKALGFLNQAMLWSNSYLLKLLNNQGLDGVVDYLEMVLAKQIIVTNSIFDSVSQRAKKAFLPIAMEQVLGRVKERFCKREQHPKDSLEQVDGAKVLMLKEEAGSPIKYCCLAELKADQACYGFLILLSEEPVSVHEQIILKRAVEPLVAHMIKQNELMEGEKKYKESFLYDLLHNNIECQQSIVKQGQLWGWNLAIPHQLLIIEAEPGFYPEIQLTVARYLAKQFKNPIMAELSGQLVVLIPDLLEKTKRQHKEYIKGIAALLQGAVQQQLPKLKMVVGIGRYYNNVCQLCRSYQEAKTALELGKFFSGSSKVNHFEDLGIMRLLASLRYEQLEDFANEYLEELIAFDNENKTNLVETLQVYFQQNGDFKAIANQLYIHANTLRYRLKKIEEMLEIDLQNSEDNLNLLVALKIMAMGQNK